MRSSDARTTLRFGDFELDVAAYELRRLGRRVRLGRQPMDLLILLVESRGQLVSRTDIVERLWGKDVFVDVETGVNTAISKIRQALRDLPDRPTFLETVPGKGYRFIAPVEAFSAVQPSDSGVATPAPLPEAMVAATVEAIPVTRPRLTVPMRFAIGLLAGSLAIGLVVFAKLRSGSPAATSVTIAVLPFENLGSDPERSYLAASLTDETSASLAQIDPEHLSVKGRTLSYKGTRKTATEIGRELSVDYLVESSIRAEGTRLRVTVTLIRVSDQQHAWSQSYDREPTSLLGLQQELSTAISEQVLHRVSPDRAKELGRRQTHNAQAYDAYLKGRYQTHRRTAEANARAIELYKQAIAIDEQYALAWSDLAFVYAGGAINGDARPAVVGPLARAAAVRAVGANPNLSESQMVLGYHLWLIDWNWHAAEAAIRLAIQLDPSNAAASLFLGHVLSQSGRPNEAENSMRRARDLDPLDAVARALSSQIAFQGRDVAGALEHARRAIALDPNLWIGYMELGQAHVAAGDHELALEALVDAARFSGGNSKAISLRGYVLAKMGRVDAAREVLRTLETASRERYVPPFAMALVYAGLDEREAMFDALERAFTARDVHLMYLPVDMKWDPYRTDPRFVDLLARCAFTSSR
jgi:TolB-like protein/DNA-binding winged helix-turn-helix (wHTH) protein/tetratricopeptide (TPR) repeat protein